ncbi:MAG: hypothetical protein FJ315_03130, partial [SAR202 cluster bacterium]|nr:hypothetical protein [SAR202 cluster bacterium]
DILPLYSAAGPASPGVAPARREGFEKDMKRALRASRSAGEWVLVSVHWGKERQRESTPRQRRLGRSLIDWGAHVVIGHHTHVLGEVEQYKRGWIHYSLGNFVGPWGKRADVGVWEVVFQPDVPIRQRLVMRRWDGSPRPPARPARKRRR